MQIIFSFFLHQFRGILYDPKALCFAMPHSVRLKNINKVIYDKITLCYHVERNKKKETQNKRVRVKKHNGRILTRAKSEKVSMAAPRALSFYRFLKMQ